ncbi:phosducin-like protein [Cavenderia fasciculata]|uniref:Phosducin-like protein n=1 Tax=Cavenderia fasciculata TaxID=261658 RepID=F4Q920_CACFS|nr:phosducin-like protein [Cavenderia fasciculata]EGG15189.1 phosducin-like protein [Cavenderia fasciculata]|eukprot:XP_004351909.1 phosducin-like protein [Cavenderia fasciculata]
MSSDDINTDNAIQNELAMLLDKVGDNDDKRYQDSGDEKDNDNNDNEEKSDNGSDYDPADFVIPDELDTAKPQAYRTRGGNTGIKGVLGDYAEHQNQKRQDYLSKQQLNKAMLEKMCVTVKDDKNQKPTDKDDDKQDSDDEDLQRIRQQRLNELKNKQQKQKNNNNSNNNSCCDSLPSYLRPQVYGFLKQISKSEYIDEVDNVPPNVFVIIHLFQNYIPECVKLNQLLSQLAVKYSHIKFLKILSTEAKVGYHDEALPTLLVYIGGQLLVSFIPVTEELEGKYVKEDLELLLASYDIIPNPDVIQNQNWEKSLSLNKQSRHDDNDYSDESDNSRD